MKEIMREYGRAIIAAIVALCMLGFVKHQLENLASKAVFPSNLYENYADAGETAQAMERKRPEICCKDVEITVGSEWRGRDLFEVQGVNGAVVTMHITKAESPKHTEIEVKEDKIRFVQQGIYRIWVRATDEYSGMIQKMFSVPVRGGIS